MIRLAHISDTHFGTEEPPVCRALHDDLLAQAPDIVVLTGDVTQRARAAQFRAARAFLDALAPIPVLALPGNHDLPLFDLLTRFVTPYKLFRRHICDDLAPAWENGQIAVLGVNSTRLLRHKHGALPPELVSEVAARLAALPHRFKIVALHHPLAVVQDSDLRNRPRGADGALAAWIGAGADLFLGGHIHLPYCLEVSSGARRALVLQASTAVSRRRRAGRPNGYALVRVADDEGGKTIAIEQRDHDPTAGCFVSGARYRASVTEGGWCLIPAGAPPLD